MKFGQLIECNLRNSFLQKAYTICGGETSPRPFSEKLKLSLSLDQQSKVLYSLFLLCWGLSKYIETKLQITCFHLILSFVKKSKEVWNQSLCLIFCIIFEEKYFACYILLIDHISLSVYLYFVRYWEICVLQLFVNQVVRFELWS